MLLTLDSIFLFKEIFSFFFWADETEERKRINGFGVEQKRTKGGQKDGGERRGLKRGREVEKEMEMCN